MRHRCMLCRATLGLVIAASLAAPVSAASREVCRIGMAIDGPWERNDQIRGLFEHEIHYLAGDEFDVRFPPDKRLQADWTLAGVKEAVDRLLADPEVDIVLAAGPISSAYVCGLSELPRPVIAPFIFSTEIQAVPFEEGEDGASEGTSGVDNLTYATFQHDIKRELEQFRKLIPFNKLAVLVSQGLYDAVPAVKEWYDRELSGLGLEVSYIPVAGSAEEVLARIPEDADAVYVGPLLELTTGEYDIFIAGLTERRLPSFAMWGRGEVKKGLFASFYLSTDFGRLGRRIAVDVYRILRGENAGDLPVVFRRGERLTVNMATARAIGIYPRFSAVTEAELVQEEPTEAELSRSLSLLTAAEEAVAVNLDLAAADREVAAGLQDVREARSRLRPQVEIAAVGTLIDSDRARASFGAFAEQTVGGSLILSQVVYSEPARSDVEIQSHLQTLREQAREQRRLDIILEATTAYLTVRRAKTIQEIQRDDLETTRLHLELARSRQAIGAAGQGEILRWESDIAARRRAVLDAIARRQQSEVALNRVLHRPLEEQFATEDVDLEDPAVMCSLQRLRPYLDDYRSWSILRDFMVEEAVAASPELHQLDAAIAAQERALLTTRRAFTHPTVALQGEVNALSRSGAGTDSSLGDSLPLDLPAADDVEWLVGVRAALPLLDGGARRAAKERAREDLARLRLEREATQERVAERMRSALHAVAASHAGVDLAESAFETAQKNLALVEEAYAQGAVSITDLTDANAAELAAELGHTDAVYDFLIDMMNVERALGRFDMFLGDEERESFYQRVADYFAGAAAGGRPLGSEMP